MDVVGGIANFIKILAAGGGPLEILQDPAAGPLVVVAAGLIIASLIGLGISGGWRDTPLAWYFGLGADPDNRWAERLRDRDNDL